MVRPFISLDHGNEVVTITVGPEDNSVTGLARLA